MGIDIYAFWKGQREEEKAAQSEAWSYPTEGALGYLREAYHGSPYATRHFCPEAFQTKEPVPISAAVLEERLPFTLELVEERECKIYNSEAKQIEAVKQSFRDFVALCRREEDKTGEAVRILADY